MSWDVLLTYAGAEGPPLGLSGAVEAALTQAIPGLWIEGQGPARFGGLDVAGRFSLRVHFLPVSEGSDQVQSLCLCIQTEGGDPHEDAQHPIWDLIAGVVSGTGWVAEDTFGGALGRDGRPLPRDGRSPWRRWLDRLFG